MIHPRTLPYWLLVMALVMLTGASVAVAQSVDRPCAEEVVPEDGFQSAGVGLTRPELVALYGAEEIGQGSLIYDYQGIDLHKVECDLILAFPLDLAPDQDMGEVALAESLLPADAEYVGAFTIGTTIAPNRDQTATLWRSESLAERFALLGDDRGGKVLILYTYEPMGMERGPIERIELRTVELAE
jgi:hypothetical protein